MNPRTRNIPQLPGQRRVVRAARTEDIVNQIVHSPNFPGGQNGASIEAVREFISNQVRIQGERFTGGIGTQEFDIDISGTAKFFLGIQFNDAFDADVKLEVNNETIFSAVSVNALTPIGNPRSSKDWFPVNRPLAGSDKIKLTITGFEVYENTPFTIYYI